MFNRHLHTSSFRCTASLRFTSVLPWKVAIWSNVVFIWNRGFTVKTISLMPSGIIFWSRFLITKDISAAYPYVQDVTTIFLIYIILTILMRFLSVRSRLVYKSLLLNWSWSFSAPFKASSPNRIISSSRLSCMILIKFGQDLVELSFHLTYFVIWWLLCRLWLLFLSVKKMFYFIPSFICRCWLNITYILRYIYSILWLLWLLDLNLTYLLLSSFQVWLLLLTMLDHSVDVLAALAFSRMSRVNQATSR